MTIRSAAARLGAAVAVLGGSLAATAPAADAAVVGSFTSCTVTWRSCTSSSLAANYSKHYVDVEVRGAWLCSTTYRVYDARNGVTVAKGSVGPTRATRFLVIGLYSEYRIRLDACGGATGYLRNARS
jgi:hypothetical protein